MARIIWSQLLATLAVAIISALVGGKAAGFSAMLGGLCCTVPNALFAVRLYLSANKLGGANPATFFVWEFVKIGLTLAALATVVWLYRDVNWLAFIVGIVIVLKSYLFLLFRNQI